MTFIARFHFLLLGATLPWIVVIFLLAGPWWANNWEGLVWFAYVLALTGGIPLCLVLAWLMPRAQAGILALAGIFQPPIAYGIAVGIDSAFGM